MTTILPPFKQILTSFYFTFLLPPSAMLRTQFLFQMQMLTKEKHVILPFPWIPHYLKWVWVAMFVSGEPISGLNYRKWGILAISVPCQQKFGTGAWKHWVNWLGAAWIIQLHGVIRLDRVFVVDQSHLLIWTVKAPLSLSYISDSELQLSWVLTWTTGHISWIHVSVFTLPLSALGSTSRSESVSNQIL